MNHILDLGIVEGDKLWVEWWLIKKAKFPCDRFCHLEVNILIPGKVKRDCDAQHGHLITIYVSLIRN